MSGTSRTPAAIPSDSSTPESSRPIYEEPWRMYEIVPHVFISAWPPAVPDNITHTVNVCDRLPVIRHDQSEMINHWNFPIFDDNSTANTIALITHVVKNALSDPRLLASWATPPTQDHPLPPSPETNILIYSEHGSNRAAIAVLAHLCESLHINVVDAYFILKAKKKDIEPSEKLMEQVQSFMRQGDEYEGSVGKEILRRVVKEKGFRDIMKKAREEDWMYEPDV
ncbi:hypothetical protein VTL71DRAFT_9886 [Oculimacula yallundae]|uniref:Tyrosine-protein phosphatase domain-containing protein n=1 Tax=Oculimacula yallundae TaxID=86028 RepID=A0ABR4BSP2_9HELO